MPMAGEPTARVIGLEIESVAAILPLHAAQRHTCLCTNGRHIGLILNFNARRRAQRIHRSVL